MFNILFMLFVVSLEYHGLDALEKTDAENTGRPCPGTGLTGRGWEYK